MDLKGKTALITGGGIRLGRAFALALARQGAHLAVHYNSSEAPAEETAQLARSLGVRAVTVEANFNSIDAVERVFPKALAEFDRIDILINNAAIYLKGTGEETSRETWEKQFRINLQAPFILTQAFARQLPPGQRFIPVLPAVPANL